MKWDKIQVPADVSKANLFQSNMPFAQVHYFGYDLYGIFYSPSKKAAWMMGRLVTVEGRILDKVLVSFLRTKCTTPLLYFAVYDMLDKTCSIVKTDFLEAMAPMESQSGLILP